MSEELKNYYVFRYVYDPVAEGFTSIEGDIVGYTKATDPFDACNKLGFDDPNQYFAKPIDDPRKHLNEINNERDILDKLTTQLNPILQEFNDTIKNPICPNCGGKLDNEYNCPDCTFGHENDKPKKKSPKKKKK